MDWNYWNPIIHNGIAVFFATCGGAIVGGWLTKNGFLTAIEHQLKTEDDARKNRLSWEIFPYFSEYVEFLKDLPQAKQTSLCVPVSHYFLPADIISKVMTLPYLSFEEKEEISSMDMKMKTAVMHLRDNQRLFPDFAFVYDENNVDRGSLGGALVGVLMGKGSDPYEAQKRCNSLLIIKEKIKSHCK